MFRFLVYNYWISKRKPGMIKSLLCKIYKDKKNSMKVIISFKMVVQKWKTFKGKILRLRQIAKICFFFQTTEIRVVSKCSELLQSSNICKYKYSSKLPGSKKFSRKIPTSRMQSKMVDSWKNQVNFH